MGGQTLNPYDLSRTPGGSSGGTGAGIVPYSFTQDAAGPITRTMEDAAKVLDAIAGYDSDDPATTWGIGRIPRTYTAFLDKDGLKGARIGVLRKLSTTLRHISQEISVALVRFSVAQPAG